MLIGHKFLPTGLKVNICFNRALLAKLAWRLVRKDDSPWVKMLLAKYYNKEDFWDVEQKHSYSWI